MPELSKGVSRLEGGDGNVLYVGNLDAGMSIGRQGETMELSKRYTARHCAETKAVKMYAAGNGWSVRIFD